MLENILLGIVIGLDGVHPRTMQDRTLRGGAIPVKFFAARDLHIPEDVGLK